MVDVSMQTTDASKSEMKPHDAEVSITSEYMTEINIELILPFISLGRT